MNQPAESISELVACHDCDLLLRPPSPAPGQVARCPRCGAVLARGRSRPLDATLALTLAAVDLFLLANPYPFMTFSLEGCAEENRLITGVIRRTRDGHVGQNALSDDARSVRYQIHIDSRYATLVRENSRFWNASGISAHFGLGGLDVETESLESILAGGVGRRRSESAPGGASPWNTPSVRRRTRTPSRISEERSHGSRSCRRDSAAHARDVAERSRAETGPKRPGFFRRLFAGGDQRAGSGRPEHGPTTPAASGTAPV